MKAELEKEIERLNALLAIEDDEIMLLRERLLEAHSDAQRRLAEASAENARLRQEIEQLRENSSTPAARQARLNASFRFIPSPEAPDARPWM